MYSRIIPIDFYPSISLPSRREGLRIRNTQNSRPVDISTPFAPGRPTRETVGWNRDDFDHSLKETDGMLHYPARAITDSNGLAEAEVDHEKN